MDVVVRAELHWAGVSSQFVISKSKIDALGDRLKGNRATDEDLRSLDEFRRSFSPAYESVIRTVTDQLGLKPTGRPAKSTASILDKLSRESIRLTQIQDIAGCRLLVSNIADQDRVVSDLLRVFPGAKVVDRRASPSHGYRAIHVIVNINGRAIEIQIRTSLQHLWAELSEKLSDIIDPAIKYGGGDEEVRLVLATGSDGVRRIEKLEQRAPNTIAEIKRLEQDVEKTSSSKIINRVRKLKEESLRLTAELTKAKEEMLHLLESFISGLAGQKE